MKNREREKWRWGIEQKERERNKERNKQRGKDSMDSTVEVLFYWNKSIVNLFSNCLYCDVTDSCQHAFLL